MSNMKRFLGTAGTYFIGSVFSKLIAFFLLPLYTNKLSPAEFGTYDLIVTILSFLVPIVFFQIWDGMFRFSFDKEKSSEKYMIVSNTYFSFLVSIILYTTIFIIVYSIFKFNYPYLIYLYGAMIALQYHYTFIARAFLKNNLFVLSGLVNALFSALINISLILNFEMGIESLYIAAIIGSLLQVLIIEFTLNPIRHFKIRDIRIKLIIEMLRFSIPLSIASVSYWLLSGYTKVIITQQLGTYENGLYAVANRFSITIALIVSVFQYAWNEMAYLMSNDNNRIEKYEKSIKYMLSVVILGSAIFILSIKIIFPYFIGDSYLESLLILPISLIGVAFNSLAGFLGTIFMAEKSTRYITTTTILSALINIIFLWTFTPVWGLLGAVSALSLAFILLSVSRMYIIFKKFKLKFTWTVYIRLFSLLSISVYIFYTVDGVLGLMIAIVIFACFLFYSLRELFSIIWNGVKNKV